MPYKPLRDLKPELFADEKDKLEMLAVEVPDSDEDVVEEADIVDTDEHLTSQEFDRVAFEENIEMQDILGPRPQCDVEEEIESEPQENGSDRESERGAFGGCDGGFHLLHVADVHVDGDSDAKDSELDGDDFDDGTESSDEEDRVEVMDDVESPEDL